ncbi:hypothetical protein B0T25DRAFT_569930 [Lasiosphaeria hispida]|uniref:Uncharacterized protein n=1 Tax=Lasiosphaeria hispida TaxID=260671 RepID=A0AAJ0HEB5_9PEZI|nr:hypothetical protein B0T25DRAFT_569930 [Lasiosphaeria hispida]
MSLLRNEILRAISWPTVCRASKAKWKFNGLKESYDCAPYGIADMNESGGMLEKFVDDTLLDAIRFYIDEKDTLLHNTYTMAYRYAQSAENGETLGMMPHQCDQNCPNTGLIPTPPVFSAQMEIIMTARILRPAKKQILRLLRDLIHEQQRQSWFPIYLSLFILLHSCALLTAANIKRARKQGIQVGYFNESLMEELHNGAKILLAYFHHCNKGSYPFTMDWSSPDQMVLDEFTPEQIHFMREMSAELEKHAGTFRTIRKSRRVEHEYYFLLQMYVIPWKP